jgi:hypothetical protein
MIIASFRIGSCYFPGDSSRAYNVKAVALMYVVG